MKVKIISIFVLIFGLFLNSNNVFAQNTVLVDDSGLEKWTEEQSNPKPVQYPVPVDGTNTNQTIINMQQKKEQARNEAERLREEARIKMETLKTQARERVEQNRITARERVLQRYDIVIVNLNKSKDKIIEQIMRTETAGIETMPAKTKIIEAETKIEEIKKKIGEISIVFASNGNIFSKEEQIKINTLNKEIVNLNTEARKILSSAVKELKDAIQSKRSIGRPQQ